MHNEAAAEAFEKYGSVTGELSQQMRSSLLCQNLLVPAEKFASQFLVFSCSAHLEVQRGTGILLVSADPDGRQVEKFPLSPHTRIRPNVYFAFVAITPELSVNIYLEPNHTMDTVHLSAPHEFQPMLPRIQLRSILDYHYRIRTPGYRSVSEHHPFFELTYVDTGILHTEVSGVPYTLREKELILYGPGQFHSQHTDNDQSVSYVTIHFQMDGEDPHSGEQLSEVLLNKVFPYNKKIYTLIKTMVQESSSGAPYADSLMLCLLTEIVIRLLQSQYVFTASPPAGVARQNYRDELFEEILLYIERNIHEPITVAEICQQFSISRSSLQLLFKNAVDQSPKKYISDLKLEKSRQMLRENRYTVSEISLKLGYSSIHYFSNAFTQKYHISPSEYAKRIY